MRALRRAAAVLPAVLPPALLGALLAAAAPPAAVQEPLPGAEGPLSNDTYLPVAEAAAAELARGDRLFAELQARHRGVDDFPPGEAWIETLELGRSALARAWGERGLSHAPSPELRAALATRRALCLELAAARPGAGARIEGMSFGIWDVGQDLVDEVRGEIGHAPPAAEWAEAAAVEGPALRLAEPPQAPRRAARARRLGRPDAEEVGDARSTFSTFVRRARVVSEQEWHEIAVAEAIQEELATGDGAQQGQVSIGPWAQSANATAGEFGGLGDGLEDLVDLGVVVVKGEGVGVAIVGGLADASSATHVGDALAKGALLGRAVAIPLGLAADLEVGGLHLGQHRRGLRAQGRPRIRPIPPGQLGLGERGAEPPATGTGSGVSRSAAARRNRGSDDRGQANAGRASRPATVRKLTAEC